MQEWFELANIATKADFFCLLGCLVAVFLMTVLLSGEASSAGLACGNSCRGWLGFVAVGMFLLLLAWCCLLKIAELHGLSILCVLPQDWLRGVPAEECWQARKPPEAVAEALAAWVAEGPRDGMEGVLTAWLWVPEGLLCAGARAVSWPKRCLPHRCHGLGREAWPSRWWEWREALFGCIAWACAASLAVAAAASCQRRCRRLPPPTSYPWSWALSSVIWMFNVIGVVMLTTEPAVWFWRFLLDALVSSSKAAVRAAQAVRGGRSPRTSVEPMQNGSPRLEDAIVTMVCGWLAARWIYVQVSARLEKRAARQRPRQGVLHALANPFRAQLEDNFSSSVRASAVVSSHGCAAHLGTRSYVMPRNSSEHLGGAGADDRAADDYLHEKCRAFVKDRRRLLGEESAGAGALSGRIILQVRRCSLLEDSLLELAVLPVAVLLARRMTVMFHDEAGVDTGGVTRDWFDGLAKTLAEEACEQADLEEGAGFYGLLAALPDGSLLPRPSRADASESEVAARLQRLFAVGRLLALAVVREIPLPLSLAGAACKHILLCPVDANDIRQLEPDFYRHRVEAILRPSGVAEMEAILGERVRFTAAPTDAHRGTVEELMPGGAERLVTEDNKEEYVALLCEARLCGGIRCELACLLQGFWDVLPVSLLRRHGVTPRELAVLISGVHHLDPEEWRRNTRTGSGVTSSQVQVIDWFWDLVRFTLTEEQRCLLLHFATGASRLPPGGFVRLRPPFTLEVSTTGSAGRLPVGQTCINRITLHLYASKWELRDKLLMAITSEGFGLP